MKPPLYLRLWLHLQAGLLRWNISSTEQYMLACERDGILASDTLRYWHRLLQEDRVRLALLEARLRGEQAMAVPQEAP